MIHVSTVRTVVGERSKAEGSTRGHRRRRNEKGSSHHLCQFHGSGLDLLYLVGQLKEHFSFLPLPAWEPEIPEKNDKKNKIM